MYPGIKTNLFAAIGSLMALVLLNGCTAVSSYPYLPAADFLARPGKAILWIYYQSDSGAVNSPNVLGSGGDTVDYRRRPDGPPKITPAPSPAVQAAQQKK